MFISLVLSLAGLFKTFPEKEAITVDWPFRLHYIFSCALLFFFTSLMGVQDAFGKLITRFFKTNQNEYFPIFSGTNIRCHGREDEPWVEQYCWVTGTRAPFHRCKDL